MPAAFSPLRSFPRGALTALLAVGFLVIALGWLAAGRTSGSTSGSYREAVVGRPVRINPLMGPANQAEADLSALIFSGLMRLGPDGAPEPDLAERWEVTADQLTYTFHLRSDVTWHDGAAFDAEDVAYTIGRIQSESFTGPASLKAEWEGVQVFVDDAMTILIRIPEPAADFLVRATVGILPEHLAGQLDTGEGFEARPFERHPIGTGPYRLVSLTNQHAVLRHNTSYFGGTPPITEIELRFAESEDEQLAWLRDGEVNAALLPGTVPATTVEEATAGRDDLAASVLATDAETVLYINNQRGILADSRTRAAIAASIDTKAVVEAAGVSELPGAGVIPPGSGLYAEPSREPADVEALWAAAQWERGPDGIRTREGEQLSLELVTNGEGDRTALANAIAAQLTTAGVNVEVITAPAQRVVTDYLRAGNYDLALFGWETPPDPDPYTGWHTSQVAAGNVAGFSDPEADALLEAARTTLDVTERRELYALFEARFEELGASVVISYPTMTYVHPARLAGFEPMLLVNPSSRFEDVARWMVVD